MNPQPFFVSKLSILVLYLIIPIIFASSSLTTKASYAKTDPISKKAICNFTPNPSYCNSILPNQTTNAYTFTRYAIHKSLSKSHKLHYLTNKYLHTNNLTLSKTATLALKDCKFLAQLNVDLLANALETLTGTTRRLGGSKLIDDVSTWLSAVLTNQEACLNSVKEASFSYYWKNIRNGLFLLDNTKLYSLSLALFTKAWLPKRDEDEDVNKWRRKLMLYNFDDVAVSESVTVSKDGRGKFRTIKKAVAAAPVNGGGSKGFYVIYIKEGVYEEYMRIAGNKRYVMMIGEGINKTIVTGNRNAKDGWTTFHSATFVVDAPHFVAVNMTFSNSAGPTKHQAVAVRNGGDHSAFYRCSFEGYQDTLYAHSQRQFYKQCNIYGTVDFIFGNSAAVLQQCNIFPRLRDKISYITAQGRSHPNQTTGIVIDNCNIRDTKSEKGKTRAFLGRPWRDYSRTVIMTSFMDSSVVKEGWKIWRSDSALRTLYYAEYKCRGPGSNTKGRVTWPGYHILKNSNEAKKFTVGKFLSGKKWLPQTGVIYKWIEIMYVPVMLVW